MHYLSERQLTREAFSIYTEAHPMLKITDQIMNQILCKGYQAKCGTMKTHRNEVNVSSETRTYLKLVSRID